MPSTRKQKAEKRSSQSDVFSHLEDTIAMSGNYGTNEFEENSIVKDF